MDGARELLLRAGEWVDGVGPAVKGGLIVGSALVSAIGLLASFRRRKPDPDRTRVSLDVPPGGEVEVRVDGRRRERD